MANVTWGLLSKNQEDPETIEEAIDRIVEEHNEDEEAHLSAGQSLQSHKASEIIDHLARSIVLDKLLEYQRWDFPFESLDAYTKTTPNNSSFEAKLQALVMTQSSTLNDVIRMYVGEVYNVVLEWAKNPVIQFSMVSGDISGQDVYILWGTNNPYGGENDHSFGFKIDHSDEKIYGVYRLTSAAEVTFEMTGIDASAAHFYRAEISEGGAHIIFSVDGVVIAEADVAGTGESSDYLFCMSQKTFVAELHSTFIWNMSVMQDL